MSEQELNPELGDFVTFLSDKHGTTTGRIVYRNDQLLRIKLAKTQAVVDFPIGEDGLFDPAIGVTEIQIKEKRTDPHFSVQLNASIDDEIELFDTDGKSLGTIGTVAEIVATENMDALKLNNGKYLNFQFVGPKPAIGFIQVHTKEPDVEMQEQEQVEEQEQEQEQVETEPVPEFVFNPDIVQYEEEEEAQFTYSDSVQRQDMFTAFIEDVPLKRQNDPKTMLKIFRMTDVFLALKNSIVVRDGSGSLKVDSESRSYIANTIQDVLAKQTGFIPAIVPVANVKKVLYVDKIEGDDLPVEFDVFVKEDLPSLYAAQHVSKEFEKSNKQEPGFVPYIYSIFKQLRAFDPKNPDSNLFIETDQDVLRSQIPPGEIDGFPQLPLLGGKGRGQEVNTIDESFVGRINNRYVRLLGPSRTKIVQRTDRKTTETSYAVAQADTADTVGHVILSDDMLSFRQPIRSSVLIWDILASDRSRKTMKTFYDTLQKTWDDQKVLGEEDTLVENLQGRIRPSLAFIDSHNSQLLDNFGLRNLETPQEVNNLLEESIKTGQDAWNKSFQQLSSLAKQNLGKPQAPVFSNMVEKESPLFTITDPEFLKMYEEFDNQYTYSVLKSSDLSVVNEFLKFGGQTFAPFWYSLSSGLPVERFPYAKSDFQGELAKINFNSQRTRDGKSQFVAKPELNSCVHVKKYEQLKRVKEDDKQMMLFSKFLSQFNGGKQDSFVNCNICKKHLCCMHEVLLLNEFNHIGNRDVLHKALLLDFAGPAFEGSYICKVCGQKIREIEFDSSLEYDDEGRPLVGRAVIEEDKNDDLFDILLNEETEEKKDAFPFKGDDLVLYNNLQACFEGCGFEVNVKTHPALYNRAVQALNVYKTFLPREETYEKGRKGQLAKLKSEKDKREFERQYPPFSQYYSNAMVGCIGAIAVLELQTSSIPVPNPIRDCVFSLSGYPIDESGTDAVSYVTCAIVTKRVAGSFYSAASWSLETNPKRMTADIQGMIMFALESILQKKKALALVNLTEIYGGLLAEARRRLKEDLPSHANILPASFLPLQQFSKEEADEPIKNTANFQAAVETGSFETVAPAVSTRQHKLNNDIIRALHIAAKKDIIPNTNNPRSDGAGSFIRLNVAALRGCGYKSLEMPEAKQQEIELVNEARTHLKRKDPTLSANGTHIYVPWSAPETSVQVPEIDATILYKLFLKHCFHGQYEGFVHEFGKNYKCRRCDFEYPTELLYLTSAEISEKNMGRLEKALGDLSQRREDIILKQFKEQGVEITEESFIALDEQVRARKILPKIEVRAIPEVLTIVSSFSGLFEMVEDRETWTSMIRKLAEVNAQGIRDNLDRRVQLAEFSAKYDALFSDINSMCFQKSLDPFYFKTIPANEKRIKGEKESEGRTKDKLEAEQKYVLSQVTGGFLKATESPQQAPRNLMNMFVVPAEQIALSTPNVDPTVKKWFPKINPNHFIELKEIWTNQAKVVEKAIKAFQSNLTDDAHMSLLEDLEDFSKRFGAFLKAYGKVKPTADFNNDEYVTALRWASLTFLRNFLIKQSGDYACGFLLDTMRSMFFIIGKYQLTDEDIEFMIAEREEKERNFFIKKIDVLEGEMRKIELMKKKLGLGDWNVSTKNLFSYNSDWWEHEREQRAAMGLVPEFALEGAPEGAAPVIANPFSDVNDHRVAEHEDE